MLSSGCTYRPPSVGEMPTSLSVTYGYVHHHESEAFSIYQLFLLWSFLELGLPKKPRPSLKRPPRPLCGTPSALRSMPNWENLITHSGPLTRYSWVRPSVQSCEWILSWTTFVLMSDIEVYSNEWGGRNEEGILDGLLQTSLPETRRAKEYTGGRQTMQLCAVGLRKLNLLTEIQQRHGVRL